MPARTFVLGSPAFVSMAGGKVFSMPTFVKKKNPVKQAAAAARWHSEHSVATEVANEEAMPQPKRAKKRAAIDASSSRSPSPHPNLLPMPAAVPTVGDDQCRLQALLHDLTEKL